MRARATASNRETCSNRAIDSCIPAFTRPMTQGARIVDARIILLKVGRRHIEQLNVVAAPIVPVRNPDVEVADDFAIAEVMRVARSSRDRIRSSPGSL